MQHIFRTLFPRNTNGGLLLDMDLYVNDAILPPEIVLPQFQHNFLPWSLIFVFSIKSYEFWYCASSSTPYNLFRVSSDPMELNGIKKSNVLCYFDFFINSKCGDFFDKTFLFLIKLTLCSDYERYERPAGCTFAEKLTSSQVSFKDFAYNQGTPLNSFRI